MCAADEDSIKAAGAPGGSCAPGLPVGVLPSSFPPSPGKLGLHSSKNTIPKYIKIGVVIELHLMPSAGLSVHPGSTLYDIPFSLQRC